MTILYFMRLSTKADFYLILATLMWGATFPLTRNALTEVDPPVFVVLRFALASLVLLPTVWTLFRETTRFMLRGSFIIAAFDTMAYLCQTIGLQTVESARAAFITGASIIFVPFLAPLFKLGKLTSLNVSCALIGFLGLYVLTGMSHFHMTSGDLWILLGAIGFSFQIVYLQRLTQAIDDYRLITFYQLFLSTIFIFLFTQGHTFSTVLQWRALIGILFCAIFATSLAYYLQNKYQKITGAPRAALIFALEPVFASLFGFLLNHELLSRTTVYGGLLLLLSLVLPNLVNIGKGSVHHKIK